ncbi:MAG: ABC transporter ATP-binding protein [Candidatus Saccharimonas sp.]
MSKQDIAVKVSHIYKSFKLPHENTSSAKSLFVNPFKGGRKLKTETQYALDDIDFDIKKGEFFGIVGRNGSGKSTLLKLIAGIYQPTSGNIEVSGRLVPFIELGVGFNPELTGRENVYLNGALMGFSTKEVDARYDAIVEFAELERFMDQILKNYSSGMQVRLAFSVATILADSDVLLIDEVLAVGDAAFQRKCFNYFRTLKKLNKTVVFVSHDMESVREYCDRCVMIDKSRIIYVGSPEVAAEKYIKLFNSEDRVKKQHHSEEESRWGSGSAKVSNVKVDVSEDTIRLKVGVKFYQRMEEPVMGFGIKNTSGVIVCGTNSKILKTKTGTYRVNEEILLEWVVPNIFGDDEYVVETAVTDRDGVTQADWWHDAATFIVRNDESTPHVVSPKIKIKIT